MVASFGPGRMHLRHRRATGKSYGFFGYPPHPEKVSGSCRYTTWHLRREIFSFFEKKSGEGAKTGGQACHNCRSDLP